MMLIRGEPELEQAITLSDIESSILDCLISDLAHDPPPARTLSLYVTKVAGRGGYLVRANDSPPSNIVMQRGLGRLSDIALSAILRIKDVGN